MFFHENEGAQATRGKDRVFFCLFNGKGTGGGCSCKDCRPTLAFFSLATIKIGRLSCPESKPEATIVTHPLFVLYWWGCCCSTSDSRSKGLTPFLHPRWIAARVQKDPSQIPVVHKQPRIGMCNFDWVNRHRACGEKTNMGRVGNQKKNPRCVLNCGDFGSALAVLQVLSRPTWREENGAFTFLLSDGLP